MSEFIVHTYAREIEFLKSWVKLKENTETGGDLFGLWLNKNEVAIQLITGPGQKCRRTPVSFYQDVGYLESVGSHLTAKEGLCNVGEWHSHHRLGLARPSQGDEATVWRSMPAGLTNFVLFIANISCTKKGTSVSVNVGCFLFDKASHEVVSGKFVHLSEPVSPLRSKGVIGNLLGNGAEKEPAFDNKRRKQKKRKKNKGKSQTGEGCSFEDNKEVFDVNDEEATNWTTVNRKEKSKSEERNAKIARKEEIKKMDDNKNKAINEEIQKKEKTNADEERKKDNVGNSRVKVKTDTTMLKGKKNEGKRKEQRKEEKLDGVEAEENDEEIGVEDQEGVIADAAQNQNEIAEVVDRKDESTSPLMLKGRKEKGKMGEQRKERKIDGEEVEEAEENESDEEIGVENEEAIIAGAAQNPNKIGEDVDKNEESKPRSGKRSKVGKDVEENVSEKVEGKEKVFSPKHQGNRKTKKKPSSKKRGKKR